MTINNDNIYIIQIFKTMKDPGTHPLPLFTLMRCTSDKSLGWMVTRLACMVQRLMSSMSLTSQASMALLDS